MPDAPAADDPRPILNASDIARWTYCNRAWWLARAGVENHNQAALHAGSVVHETHVRRVADAHRTRILSLVLLLGAAIALLIGLLTLLLA